MGFAHVDHHQGFAGLQAGLQLFEAPHVQRWGCRLHQGVHLAFDPGVVMAEFADVFKHQLEQAQQGFAHQPLFLGHKRQPESEVGHLFAQRTGVGVRRAQQVHQVLALLGQFGVAVAHRRQCVLHDAGHLFQHLGGQARGWG